jgi:alkanesulfonate monooxygenase SsuD/methylene tetrahydromethanopterin reductase-like flavin-dependent oxidoreductase (luciferase family)
MNDLDLGKVGVFTTLQALGEERAGEVAKLAEELGYRVFWLGGSPQLANVRPLLEATDTLIVATSIVNVCANDPTEVAAEYASLARDFPD